MPTRLIFRQARNQGRKIMSLNMLENTSIQSLTVDNADISTTQDTLQAVDDFQLASQTLSESG